MDVRTQFMNKWGFNPNNPEDVQAADTFIKFFSSVKGNAPSTALPEKPSVLSDASARFSSGVDVLQSNLYGLTGDEAGEARNLREAALSLAGADKEVSERIQAISEADWGEAIKMGITDPQAIVALIAQSLPSSLAVGAGRIAGGLAGSVAGPAGAVAGAIAGGGAASFGLEFRNSVIELLQEAGVEPTEENIKRVLGDKETSAAIYEYAAKRAAPIGAFDAATMGLAGRFLPMGKIVGSLTETGVQAAGGVAGEVGAQQLSEGQVSKPGAAVLEGLTEAATAVPQAIIQPAVERMVGTRPGETEEQAKVRDIAPKLSKQEQGRLAQSPITEEEYRASLLREQFDAQRVREAQPKSTPGTIEAPASVTKKGKQKIANAENFVLGETRMEQMARKVDELKTSADGLTAPKTIKRAPVKQREARLKALKKAELVSFAQKANITNIDLTQAKKVDLAKALASRYDVVPDATLGYMQPVQPTVQQQPTQAVLPEAMTRLTKADKKQLTDLANSPTASTVQKKAAVNWLSSLPERANKIRQVNRALSLPETTPMHPNMFETLNNAHTKARPGDFARTLVEADPLGVFSNENVQDKLVEAYVNSFKTPEQKQAARKLANTPKKRREAVGVAFERYLKSPKSFKGAPVVSKAFDKLARAYNEFTNVPEGIINPDTLTDEQVITSAATQEYLEKYRADNPSIASLMRPTRFTVTEKDGPRYSNLEAFGRTMNRLNMFRTMGQYSRNVPAFIPTYKLSLAKIDLSQALQTRHLTNIQKLVEVFGQARTSKALNVLEEMSRPFQKGGIQRIITRPDNRILYTNKDGKRLLIDLETSEAVRQFQNLLKDPLRDTLQVLVRKLSAIQGVDVSTMSIEQMRKSVEEGQLSGAFTPIQTQMMNTLFKGIEEVTLLLDSDRAYFPHERSSGPFGIAYYAKGENGKNELVYFAAVPADATGGRPDMKAVEEINNDAREEMERDGRTWTTFDGGGMGTATPFFKNREAINRMMSKHLGKNKYEAAEVMGQFLATKGLPSDVVSDALKSIPELDQIELMYANLRERKGYYGYDKADPIDVVARYMLRSAHQSSRFAFDGDINDAYAAFKTATGLNPGGEQFLKEADAFVNYVRDPADSAGLIREAGFWYFLAGNPSTAFLQLLNPFINTMSWMASYVTPGQFARLQVDVLANHAKIGKSLSKLKAFSTNMTGENVAQTLNIPKDEGDVLATLINLGVIDPKFALEQTTEDLASNIRRPRGKFGAGSIRRSSSMVGMVVDKGKSVLSGMISGGEMIGRINSALLLLKSFRDPANAEKMGKMLYERDKLFKAEADARFNGDYTNKELLTRFAIEENHGLFGKESRMPVLRSGLGSFVLMFMQYPQTIMELLGRQLLDRGPEGRKAFFMMTLFYPLLFGGIMAVPASETFDWLLRWYQRLTGDTNARGIKANLERVLVEMGYGNFSNLVTQGAVFSTLGIDAGSRISPQILGMNLLGAVADPDKFFGSNTGQVEFLGPFGALFQSAAATSAQIEAGANPAVAFAKNFSPIFMRNYIKAAETYMGSLSTSMGKPLIEDPNDPLWSEGDLLPTGRVDDVIKDALGFRTELRSSVAKARLYPSQEQQATTQQFSKFYNRIAVLKREIREATSEEERSQKRVELKEEMSKLREFNSTLGKGLKKNPMDLIRGVNQSTKRRIEEADEPFGVQKKGQAAGIRERYEFSPELEERIKER